MLTPERLLRFMIELIFVLLGSLVVWLGLARRIYVDRHSAAWLILSVALILWGLRALYKPGQWWLRWQNWTRGLSLALLGVLMLVTSRVPFAWVGPMLAGLSLALLGVLMLVTSRVPFAWVGPMLAAGGGLLVLRGMIGAFLIFRPR